MSIGFFSGSSGYALPESATTKSTLDPEDSYRSGEVFIKRFGSMFRSKYRLRGFFCWVDIISQIR